jgi:multicomponent Na+:H+ antiporter subunit D
MGKLFLFIPFAALAIFNFLPRRIRGEFTFWVIGLVFTLQILASVLVPSMGNLSRVVIFTAGVVGLSSGLVGRSIIREKQEWFNFANLLLISLIGLNGIALASDLFTLYVFIEVAALSSFILIIMHKEIRAYEAAWKYLILSSVASLLMLSAAAFFLLVAGGVSFSHISQAVHSGNGLCRAAVALFVCGFFIKGGLVPFHGWLPDAYTAAPTPVSILLAGIVTKASGIYPLARLLYDVVGLDAQTRGVLLLIGAVSAVAGALAALGQKNMKRMLAYSSISQMGYVILGLGAGTKLGLAAAMFHFFNHAVFKSQLFANAAALETRVKIDDMDELGGLAQRMPVTGATSILAALSASGVPPLSGFWSKLLIIIALWSAGNYLSAVVAILASVVTLAYFLLLQRKIFFGKIVGEGDRVREAEWGLLLPAVGLACITVGVGLFFPLVWPWFIR